ncbi:MAG TPA: imelysin family protein, partial [Bacillales bacterium]|nr:imelysin family protein [Bacillales bacterium]
MIGKKKTIAAILSAMMPLALAACSGTETSGANVHKETKKIETKGEASIPSEAEQLQKIAGEIGRALDADDMEQLKAAGQQLHDEWFSFEDEVRDKFPLLYTKVEKHLLPVYAQTTLKTPDVEQVKEHLPELKEALKALEHPQAAATSSGERAKLKEAVAKYKAYVEEQAGKLVESTETFVKAVKAEDLAAAKASYAEARVYYERIEPIAESFGELDPAIDARVNDVEDKANWTGFHRLEKAIWKDGTLDGQAKYADQLLNDVKQLHDKIEGVTLNAKQIVAGS